MNRLRILLADDDSGILGILQILLARDYRVVGIARDGQSLLDVAQVLRPDLVLTDVDMPVLNGIEAIRQLHKVLPSCCVVCYSAHGEPEVVAAAFEAGAADYLIKGTPQSVLSTIRSVVQRRWKTNGVCRGGVLLNQPTSQCNHDFESVIAVRPLAKDEATVGGG